jgi:DNA-binding CsgD family transcriptional regulator
VLALESIPRGGAAGEGMLTSGQGTGRSPAEHGFGTIRTVTRVAAGELVNATASAASHLDRMRTFREITYGMGASNYVIVDGLERGAGGLATIVASDWRFDAIQVIGLPAITRLVQALSEGATQAVVPERSGAKLSPQELAALRHYGHAEMVHVALNAGADRFLAIFSARARGCIDIAAVPRSRLLCSYLLSALPARRAADPVDPLSERERECLSWVAEGKTTDEVSVILGVSANTVNTYVAHAIQKLSASNRVMAIAKAIRMGII